MYPGMKEIVEWAAEAGRQEALMAAHEKRPVELDGGMGLWQAFQAKFPKEQFGAVYDEAITLYGLIFRVTAQECAKALTGTW